MNFKDGFLNFSNTPQRNPLLSLVRIDDTPSPVLSRKFADLDKDSSKKKIKSCSKKKKKHKKIKPKTPGSAKKVYSIVELFFKFFKYLL